ncbi:conserved hypothetical protein [Roseibium sp. TrichSKD4]|nr:conserved hypothetical protein [Roseibium sp. TrichSKD4]
MCNGRVVEWFKAPVLKTGVRGTVPWVRIPPLPPIPFPNQTQIGPKQLVFAGWA